MTSTAPTTLFAQPSTSTALAAVISAIGQHDFPGRLGETCAVLTAAQQVTAFSIEAGHARCLVAHRPGEADLVAALCQDYAARYHPRDALFQSCLADGEDFMARGLRSEEIGDRTYRERLFGDAGLATKFSMIGRAGGRLIYLNLYFGPRRLAPQAMATLSGLGPLLIAALTRHDTLAGGTLQGAAGRGRAAGLILERFPKLSPREAEVCGGVLCGYSSEALALELGVSRTTISTFRKRAYAKLRISSQSELFACCSGLTV